ncbi:MAG: Tim44-like domain-containing protein [Rhodocyclaceae bacterium]|nr:Tim44-like domain-containing protein [Rhodocyclaceae bacterium]
MKKTFVTLCAALIGLAMLSFDADARRLGGGSSFGMQRSPTVMRQAAPTAPTAVPAKPAPAATPPAPAPQPSGPSRWLGPLAGIAAGVGLAALLSHFGLGEGLGSMLVMLALVFGAIFVFRLLFARRQPATQYAGAGAPARFEPTLVAGGAAGEPLGAVTVPADFDVDGFLRNAKLNFVRLQAANDAGDLDDIRQFTTPEVFAEIKLQLDERGRAAQATDVVQLNAALLDLATEDKRHVASVRFHGLIREEADAAPANFDEVWHLTKPVDGSSGWMIAGIQQLQ